MGWPDVCRKRGMIFVSAAGIAVRAIAPWVKDKMTDPPVVSVDEATRFVIPLLSGHVGGANELARRIADWLGAVPVITTATDVNGKFAVDLFAAAYHMKIMDRKEAKNISAAVLDGKKIGVFSDLPLSTLPEGFVSGKQCEKKYPDHNKNRYYARQSAPCSKSSGSWGGMPQRNRSGIYEGKSFDFLKRE